MLLRSAALPLAAQTVDLTKPPVSPEPRPYKLPPVSETKLPNGLTVMLAEDARLPLVTTRLVFLAGNKRDPKDIPGLAASVARDADAGHDDTHVISRSPKQLDSLGGALDADTGADALTVEASVLAENTAKLLELMADVARNATFPDRRTGLCTSRTANRRSMVQHSQPAYLANEEFRKVRLRRHSVRAHRPHRGIDRQASTGKRSRTFATPSWCRTTLI